MQSLVYFMDLRTSYKKNLFVKLEDLLEQACIYDSFSQRDLVAVKLHFGEMGNAAFIRPVFLRKIAGLIRAQGGSPFLTDANTLYAGTRSDTPAHLQTAIHNGFSYAVVDTPLVIADGLRGRSETAVKINGRHFKEVYIGNEITAADSILSVAHFKGHELSGFGGAIKNLGMGCASRRGKMAQHSDLAPGIKDKKCVGCGECVQHCSQDALTLSDQKANLDQEKCIGCGECILVCPTSAIQIQWDQEIPLFMEKMVEYTSGVVNGRGKKVFCINFIMDVTPACDCIPSNDAPVVRDIGIAASFDPVAIDQACADLVNQEPALAGSCLQTNLRAGEDKFKGIYPHIDWAHQLDYAEKLNIGTRSYKLIQI